MGEVNLFQTHWFGCWKRHPDCAKAVLERISGPLEDAASYFDGLCDEIGETCRESLVREDWCLACRVADANQTVNGLTYRRYSTHPKGTDR